MINTPYSEVGESTVTMSEETEPKANNVIIGPWKVDGQSPAQSAEEVYRRIELFKTTRIEEVTESVIVNVFEDLFKNAYDFSDHDEANKDMAFLIEALKSMMCRHDGLDHPFQTLADRYFTIQGDEIVFVEDGGAIKVEISEAGSDDNTGC